MDPGIAMRAIAVGDGVLAAVISDRFYHHMAPQNATYPLVIYHLISDLKGRVYGGRSGLRQAHFQVDSWAKSTPVARVVANAVFDALDGYADQSPTLGVDAILQNPGSDMDGEYEPGVDIYRVIQEYTVFYRVTPP